MNHIFTISESLFWRNTNDCGTLFAMYSYDTDRTKLISFFAALCLFLSSIEYAIPKPLPFLRIGLANMPILLSLDKLYRRDILLLVVLKVLGQGFISGTIFSYVFVFSAAGSLSSALIMIVLWSLFNRRKLIGTIGLSLAGALANNAAQLLVSKFILFGDNTPYIAPVLLITGFITGTALGIFTELFKTKSHWYQSLPDTFSKNRRRLDNETAR